MLYVKTENGKILEIIRSEFKDMKEVLEHSLKTFGMTKDYCLMTPPIHGKVGVLISSYTEIGKFEIFNISLCRRTATKELAIHQATTFG